MYDKVMQILWKSQEKNFLQSSTKTLLKYHSSPAKKILTNIGILCILNKTFIFSQNSRTKNANEFITASTILSISLFLSSP
jgi:hypothetical protein